MTLSDPPFVKTPLCQCDAADLNVVIVLANMLNLITNFHNLYLILGSMRCILLYSIQWNPVNTETKGQAKFSVY